MTSLRIEFDSPVFRAARSVTVLQTYTAPLYFTIADILDAFTEPQRDVIRCVDPCQIYVLSHIIKRTLGESWQLPPSDTLGDAGKEIYTIPRAELLAHVRHQIQIHNVYDVWMKELEQIAEMVHCRPPRTEPETHEHLDRGPVQPTRVYRRYR